MHSKEEKIQEFGRLLDIMAELRVKCPWDKKQTFDSLRTCTIEEVFELTDAIAQKDMQAICKEIGDILLHAVFYSQIGSETDDFDIFDVCHALNEKLIYRHPHVFGQVNADNAKIVEQNWERLKLKEKDGNKSVLAGVPAALPAMIKAHRIQDKARSIGFDWEERGQVWSKVAEEISELKTEIDAMDKDKMEDEFGDVIFSLINACRLYDIDPENALEHTNRKFISRFNYLESKTIAQGRDLKSMTLDEMEEIWQEAKTIKN
jgi:MazG family protein